MYNPDDLCEVIERIDMADKPINHLALDALDKHLTQEGFEITLCSPTWENDYTTLAWIDLEIEKDGKQESLRVELWDSTKEFLKSIKYHMEQLSNAFYEYDDVETFYGHEVIVDEDDETAEVTLPIFIPSDARDATVTLKVGKFSSW